MAARDLYHRTVVEALEIDGWKIRRDPFTISYLNRTLLIDLEADGLSLFAEREQS